MKPDGTGSSLELNILFLSFASAVVLPRESSSRIGWTLKIVEADRQSDVRPKAWKPHLQLASLLARVKCRGFAHRRFMQVMKRSIGLTLKRLATFTILLAWNVCARIPGSWLARANLHGANAAEGTQPFNARSGRVLCSRYSGTFLPAVD
jgi:hypothetical protein